MSTSSTSRRAALLLAVPMLAVPIGVSLHAARAASPPAPTVADTPNSTADVIAHAVVDIGDGSYRWTSTPYDTDLVPTQLAFDHPTFLLAESGGATLATAESGTSWLLSAGEALFLPAGSTVGVERVGDEEARVVAWGLTPATGESTFRVEAGRRDIELLRDVVGPGDVLTLPGGSPPVVAMTTDGAAVARDPAAGADIALDAERPVVLDTPREITAGDATATIVAIVVGPPLVPGAGGASEPPPTTGPIAADVTDSTAAASTAAPTAAPTTAVPVTSGGPLRTDVTSTIPPGSDVPPIVTTTTTRTGGGGGGGSDCNPDGPGGNPCQQQ